MTKAVVYKFEENGGHFAFSNRTTTKGFISPSVGDEIELVSYRVYQQACDRIKELETELKQLKKGKDAVSAL